MAGKLRREALRRTRIGHESPTTAENDLRRDCIIRERIFLPVKTRSHARQPASQIATFVTQSMLIETAKAVELPARIKRRRYERETKIFVLAVQLAIANAVVQAREKPDVGLIVEAVSLAVWHFAARGQTPNRVSARNVVSRFVPHRGGEISHAHDIAERNLFVASVISVLAKQRAANASRKFPTTKIDRCRAASKAAIGV